VIRLAVRVGRAQAPEVLAELLVCSPAGVEEIDIDQDTLEYVLYGAPLALPSEADLQARVGEHVALTLRTSEIADDWAERWRSFHQPVMLADRLYVRPPWHPALDSDNDSGLIDLVIEPAQAFGTGAHATTRLCLELLVELERSGDAHGSLLDIGCGSGVLAIAAAKLGWSPVIALDHESESVQATADNAAANGARIDVRRADLLHDELPSAPTIVANLLRPLLLELSQRLSAAPEWLLASGLLIDQGDEIAAEFAARHGLHEQRRLIDGEWVALLLAAADRRVSS
jgi:ribosomal protein L11 methyltransferase